MRRHLLGGRLAIDTCQRALNRRRAAMSGWMAACSSMRCSGASSRLAWISNGAFEASDSHAAPVARRRPARQART